MTERVGREWEKVGRERSGPPTEHTSPICPGGRQSTQIGTTSCLWSILPPSSHSSPVKKSAGEGRSNGDRPIQGVGPIELGQDEEMWKLEREGSRNTESTHLFFL